MGSINAINISIVLSISLGIFLIWFSFYPDNLNFLKNRIAKTNLTIENTKSTKKEKFYIEFAVNLAKKISKYNKVKLSVEQEKKIHENLIKANYPLGLTPLDFYNLKFAYFIILAIVSIFIFLIAKVEFRLLVAFSLILSYYLPTTWINKIRKERLEEIEEDVTDVLDLIGVTVKHMSLKKTIETVATSKKSLSTEELMKVVNEINNGADELKAFENLKNRNDTIAFTNLYNTVKIYKKYGGSDMIAKGILEISNTFREEKMFKTKEKINKLETTMLFPMAFLLLPATTIILFAPIFFQTMKM